MICHPYNTISNEYNVVVLDVRLQMMRCVVVMMIRASVRGAVCLSILLCWVQKLMGPQGDMCNPCVCNPSLQVPVVVAKSTECCS